MGDKGYLIKAICPLLNVPLSQNDMNGALQLYVRTCAGLGRLGQTAQDNFLGGMWDGAGRCREGHVHCQLCTIFIKFRTTRVNLFIACKF